MGNDRGGQPLITVIMPVYNCECHIATAIRSVMAQTYSNWELLVLDDGCTDSTCEIVSDFARADDRIQLLRNEKNMGVARTRNRGFDLSHGEYVALLDSDDEWSPEKLQIQLDLMGRENADICYTAYAIVDESGAKVKNDYLVPERVTYDELLKENVIGCSTVMLASHILKKHRFVTDFYHEDYVLWLDLLRCGYKAVGCTKTLVKWRYLADSRSFDKRKSAKNRWDIYRKHLHLPLLKSMCVFLAYTTRGIRKYL
jgi:teichuronic acid biosynthesis glycosyltransferase TuaG